MNGGNDAMNLCNRISLNDYLKPVVVVNLLILVTALLAPDLGFAEEGWGSWGDEPDNGSTVITDERMNVFLGSSDIYVKLGVAVAAGIIVYVTFLFLFKVLIRKEQPPAKVFMMIFSSLLISWYVVLFICFSEYTLIQPYVPDISVGDYLQKLNLQLVLFSFLGWVVVSLIISSLMRGNAVSNS